MILNFTSLYIFFILFNLHQLQSMNFCERNEKYSTNMCGLETESMKRYILYDVNSYEGFNLRRDVYVRVATFMKQLVKRSASYQWNLVLPPWSNLPHWNSLNIGLQQQLPWSSFFDVNSLKKYIPVLEMYEFLSEYPSENNKIVLDHVYILKNDQEMFSSGKFIDKNLVIDCNDSEIIKSTQINLLKIFFWGYKNITAKKINCIIFHGTTMSLIKHLNPQIDRAVSFHHMEIPLHQAHGSVEYWAARRSMRYNSNLYKIAAQFRSQYLNSFDYDDNTIMPNDWRLEKENRRATGGPYLAMHYRRQDFIIAHPKAVPSIEKAAKQIDRILKYINLHTIYIATDAQEKEMHELKKKLSHYQVFYFEPLQITEYKLKDGEIAIIDQIICSHARYFIGTRESTFTMRIQEDREIMGFQINTTFNLLCGNEKKCHPESKWEIVWNEN